MKLGYLDIPFELSLTEKPDMGMVKLITDRFSEIDMPFTNPKNPKGDKVKGSGSLKIWKQYVSSLNNPIDYRSTIKNEPNRMYAVGASCQGLPSSFRNSLYRYNATDTDAVCCHPTIARSVANHYDLQSDAIDGYIRDRSDIFDIFKEKIGYAHSQTKQLFNSLLYGANIPMEVKANDITCDIADTYKKQGTALADKICLEYPNLLKDAKKRDKYQPKYSALSCYLNNIENQIVLKAMEYFASKGVPIYVYSFDGFLHGITDIPYEELNDYIFEETGIPLQFINKPMKKFIEFTNVLDLHELEKKEEIVLEPLLDFDLEPLMEFDFKLIEDFCITHKGQLEDLSTRDEYLKPIYKLCDYFFNTITDSNYLVVRHNYKMVHGKKMRKVHYAVKYNTFLSTFATDQNTKTLRKMASGLYKPCFSLTNDYFLGYEKKKKYPLLNFYPSLEPQPFYNVFKGFEYLPSGDSVSEEDIKPFLDHILHIWCKGDEKSYYHIIGLFAQAIQQPYKKWNITLVLKSKEGAGKGVILEHIARIIGKYNAETGAQGHFRPVKNQNDIFGQFTSIFEGCCMLFFDEMVWGGDKKNAGILKALITESTVKIEHKHTGFYYANSYINPVVATNEDWSVPAGDDSRRYNVHELDNKYAGIQTPESKAYFDKIINLPTQKIADFLYQYDLTKFDSREFPITEGLNNEKKMSMDSSTSWLYDTLGLETEWNEYADGFDKKLMYERYIAWCKSSHQYRVSNDVVFWKNVKMMIVKEYKPRVEGVQKRFVKFASLVDARKIWMDTVKVWDEGWDMEIEDEKRDG
jgi:hypothetical protein